MIRMAAPARPTLCSPLAAGEGPGVRSRKRSAVRLRDKPTNHPLELPVGAQPDRHQLSSAAAANHTRLLTSALLMLLLALLALPSFAAIEALPFDSPEQEQRFRTLTAELRCVMCQNQSLADSNAGIAQDLRREVLDLMKQGKSDDEIKQFLSERYTDFVLYRPPLRSDTMLLWFGPAAVLLAGGIAVVVVLRRRAKQYRELTNNKQPPSGDDW